MFSLFANMFATKNLGENGTVQHGWGVEPGDYTEENEFNSLITQLFFQLVRTNNHEKLEDIAKTLISRDKLTKNQESILVRLTLQTRDIVDGKGEYHLAYMLVWLWSKLKPREYAEKIFKRFVLPTEVSPHPMGSWKDVKFICHYLSKKENRDYWLIDYIIELAVNTAMEEYKSLETNPSDLSKISLVGKWMPREKKSCKFGWIHKKMAKIAYPDKHDNLRLWNKVITTLSSKTNTTEIKMAGKAWSEINFNNVPSRCMMLNANNFNNSNNKEDKDRIECAENYKKHKEKALKKDGNTKIHGKRLNVGELVERALVGDTDKEMVNLQWQTHKENNSGLENLCIIPCCDVSGSMYGNPLYNAVGLSIRTSEICHPAFRDKILTFSEMPSWIDLSSCETFTEKVEKITHADWGMNTDFKALCNKVLSDLVASEVDPEQTKEIILAVYSDMQMDQASDIPLETTFEYVKQRFTKAGIDSKYKKPYACPHILFWNLRETKGFPSTTFEENVTFLSGYSSSLLNIFETKGIDELRKHSAYSMLVELLKNKRYDFE